jgi:hypothetical protein
MSNRPIVTCRRTDSLERPKERHVKGLGFVANVRWEGQRVNMRYPAETEMYGPRLCSCNMQRFSEQGRTFPCKCGQCRKN